MSIEQEVLKMLVNYDPTTGIFTWIVDGRLTRKGEQVGWLDNGYIRCKIMGKTYRAHRLAFIYMLGREAYGHIDHIDTIRSNNRWDNLRENMQVVNPWNRGLQTNNSSGVKGVHWDKRKNRFIAQIQVHGKKKQVGAYSTVEEATQAIRAYRELVHEEFANHG
jgi:hypothetical protein